MQKMEVTNFRNFCLKNSGISGLGKKTEFPEIRKSEFPELQSLAVTQRYVSPLWQAVVVLWSVDVPPSLQRVVEFLISIARYRYQPIVQCILQRAVDNRQSHTFVITTRCYK